MIELVCREIDIGAARNVGGPVETRIVKFQVECSMLEARLGNAAK